MKLSPALVVICALALAGCAEAAPSEAPTGSAVPTVNAAAPSSAHSSSEPSVSPSTATGTAATAPTPTAAIPTDCSDLILSTPFSASFGSWPLNDPSVVGAPGAPYSYPAGSTVPTPAASTATLAETLSAATQLRCVWRDPQADITSMRIEMATVDPELATEYIRSLPDQGYACTAAATTADPGQMCQLDTTDPKYNVAIGDTVFLRDATYIHVVQANVSTPDLLASLEAKIWD